MKRGRFRKLQVKLQEMRRRAGSIRHTELAHFANALGFHRKKGGSEPSFESLRPGWRNISIPDHPGTLKKGTVCNILSQFEENLELLEREGEVEDEHEE